MIELQNSDIVKKVVISLVKVTKTKTSKKHAIFLLKTLKERLQEDHVCFKHIDFDGTSIDLGNLRFQADINVVNPHELGMAIQSLIDIFHKELGNKAGYFLIREFRDALGEPYHAALKEIGVDLRLSELQKELYGLTDGNYRIKEQQDSNIAYVEKR